MFVEPGEKLWETLSSITQDEGLVLYDLERVGRQVLRVFVDKPRNSSNEGESPERVTSGDCSRFVRRLMVFFTAEGPALGFGDEPEIEVSSPGVNRTLRLKSHFAEAVGERVKLVPVSPQKDSPVQGPVIGVLKALNGDVVEVAEESTGGLVSLHLSAIKKAHVDFKFD